MSTKKSLIYIEKTWVEIKNHLKKDKRLLIPIGSIEQHGHHLPLNTDTLIAEYICRRLSKELDIMVAPSFMYTFCNSGQSFPGTVSPDFTLVKDFF